MCHYGMPIAVRMDTDAIAHNDYQSCDAEAVFSLASYSKQNYCTVASF